MWADETGKRVEEIRNGKVKTIPGEDPKIEIDFWGRGI